MKRLIKATVILTIITVLLLAILNSCTRLRSYDYKPVVSYESKGSGISEIVEAAERKRDEDLGPLGNILKYEQIILVSSILLVIIFSFIFFNLAPKKK